MSKLLLHDVSYSINGKVLLDQISLSVDEHRIGIVGRNGSGKSTLARVLAGLLIPSHGTAKIDGIDMAQERRHAISKVGILFQNPDHQIIFPTVVEEMSFGLRQLGHTKSDAVDIVADTLALFEKADWLNVPNVQLSQGQRQLVCLMSVLVMKPDVIILDEPFSGLDIPTTRQLNRYLSVLDQTLVHVSHDPQIISGYDRVIWLDAGKLMHQGTPDDVLPAFIDHMEELGKGDDISTLAC